MIWQDLVLSIGGFILAVGVVPMLRSATPTPKLATIQFSLVLWAFTIAMASLGLWLGAAATAAQASMWTWLLVKAFRR